jgi:hypothetical protein
VQSLNANHGLFLLGDFTTFAIYISVKKDQSSERFHEKHLPGTHLIYTKQSTVSLDRFFVWILLNSVKRPPGVPNLRCKKWFQRDLIASGDDKTNPPSPLLEAMAIDALPPAGLIRHAALAALN